MKHFTRFIASLFTYCLFVVLPLDSFAAYPINALVLDTQAKVDAVDVSIIGNRYVVIAGTDITNVDHFAALVQVGTLLIENNPNLISLSGLAGLRKIEGSITIQNNPKLESIVSIGGLTSLGSYFVVNNNLKLTQLPTFSTLHAFPTDFQISANPELTTLTSFNNLDSIGGALRILNNGKLSSIDGFQSLKSVGYLRIGPSTGLTTLNGFPSLKKVKEEITIRGNQDLTIVSGFNQLTYVSDLVFDDNDKLGRITGFQSLTQIGLSSQAGAASVLMFINNQVLYDLSGFSNLQFLGQLSITSNGGLKNLQGLSGLRKIRKSLVIYIANNSVLENLDGLSNLKEWETGQGNNPSFNVSGNPLLTKPCGIFPLANAINNIYPDFISGLGNGNAGDITGNGFTFNQFAACGTITSPSSTPIIKLAFNENTGVAPVNTGTSSATFARSSSIPSSVTNVPSQDGNGKAFDFGVTPGNYFIESSAVVPELKGLTNFTITGWVNAKSNVTGGGGNRIVSWINSGGDGVDLVMQSNGSLRLGVNSWPDNSPSYSSPGKITVDPQGASNNWVFFAVTYSASNGEVQYYFANNNDYVTPDIGAILPANAIGANIGKLAIGAFNSATRNSGTYDRMFRGAIDDIQIFGSVLNLNNLMAVLLSNRDTTPPAKVTDLAVVSKTPTSVTLQWSTPSDNAGVTGYYIAANDTINNHGIGTQLGKVNSYTFTDLEPGTVQKIVLTAFDRSRNSSTSNVVIVTIPTVSPAPSALVHLNFNESGLTYGNTGTATGTFSRSPNVPLSNANTPVVGGSYSLDFGISPGNYYVSSAAPVNELKNLSAFTITGWLNNKSSVVGGGGNRIVSWINSGGEGVDLVYQNNGSVRLGVNQWPDATPAFSSANKVTTNSAAPATNWVFFAVTYQSDGKVEFYFGSNTRDAEFDVSRTYAGRGAAGSNIGKLAVGAFNDATRNAGTYDRMFRGLIDDIQIYNSALSPVDIVTVQRGAPQMIDGIPPSAPIVSRWFATQTTVGITWTAATDNNGVTKYRIFDGDNFIQEVGGNVTSYIILGLTPSTSYGLNVRAYDAKGNISVPGNTVTETTTAADPQAPLVLLRFNEQNSQAPYAGAFQEGTASAAFVRNGVNFSTSAPAAVGGGASYDFGTTPANNFVESTATVNELKNLSAFTLTGWLNTKSNVAGPGGNRVISWINSGGDGVDLVYNSNGSLQLGVNQWPDGSPALSSPNKVTTNASAPSTNWVFFAVTYRSDGQVQFYFGSDATPAAIDVVKSYAGRGTTGNNIGKLAAGAFNDVTRNTSTYDRMFKGLIDDIRVYGRLLTQQEIRTVQSGVSSAAAGRMNVAPSAPETIAEESGEQVAQLYQNYPNPFNAETTIDLYVPHAAKVARVIVIDVSGRPLRNIEVKERGKTSVTIGGGDLNNGMYFYSLLIDGRTENTKRMAITK